MAEKRRRRLKDIWEYPETLMILMLFISYPAGLIKKERIAEHLEKSPIGKEINKDQLGRVLDKLIEEGFIENPQWGYYKLKEKRYPPIYHRISIDTQEKFYPQQMIPLSHRNSSRIYYGLNPDLMDTQLMSRLEKADKKIFEGISDLRSIKADHIDKFILKKIEKSNADDDIRTIMCKHANRYLFLNDFIRREIIRLYCEEKPRIQDKFYWDRQKVKEYIEKKKKKHIALPRENIPDLSEEEILGRYPDEEDKFFQKISSLSKAKKEMMNSLIIEIATELREMLPVKKHGIVAINPDIYPVLRLDSLGLGIVPISPISELQDITYPYRKHREMIDSAIKNGSTKIHISRILKEIFRNIEAYKKEFGKEKLLAGLITESEVRREIASLQYLNRIITCPDCGKTLLPKAAVGKKEIDKEIHFYKIKYFYRCDCTRKKDRKKDIEYEYAEIDIESLEKLKKELKKEK